MMSTPQGNKFQYKTEASIRIDYLIEDVKHIALDLSGEACIQKCYFTIENQSVIIGLERRAGITASCFDKLKVTSDDGKPVKPERLEKIKERVFRTFAIASEQLIFVARRQNCTTNPTSFAQSRFHCQLSKSDRVQC